MSKRKKLPFMKVWVRDFFDDEDVAELSAIEQGLYMVMLMRAWENGGWLPADDTRLAKKIGLSTRMWKSTFKSRLLPFFVEFSAPLAGPAITQRRLMIEWKKAADLRAQRIVNLGLSEDDYGTKSKAERARPETKKPRQTGTPNRAPDSAPEQAPHPRASPRAIAHSSIEERADAAANHQASEEALASLSTLHPREEARPHVEPEDAAERGGDRAGQGALPEPVGAAEDQPEPRSLFGRLEARRRERERQQAAPVPQQKRGG